MTAVDPQQICQAILNQRKYVVICQSWQAQIGDLIINPDGGRAGRLTGTLVVISETDPSDFQTQHDFVRQLRGEAPKKVQGSDIGLYFYRCIAE